MEYQGSLTVSFLFLRLVVCDFAYDFDSDTKYHQLIVYECDLFLVPNYF